jgi:hypothetical protein
VTPRSQSISNRAEDLVQSAFTKLYLARNRVSRHEVLDAYVHQMLVRTLLDERRRGWWRRERVTDSTVEQPLPPDPSANRLVMLQALAAVLVLRYWEDLSVEDTEDQVREALRGAVAASGPPPPMSTTTTLEAARRARLRRRTAWACAGRAAAVAVVAIASADFAGVPSAAGGYRPAAPGGAQHRASEARPERRDRKPWPAGPDGKPQEDRTARADSRFDQGVRLLDEVVAAVPPDTPARGPGQSTTEPDAAAVRPGPVRGAGERHRGVELHAEPRWRRATGPGACWLRYAPRGPLGGTPVRADAAVLGDGMGGDCQVVTVGAVQVGVVVQPTGDDRFDQWAAYRHPDGVVVFVAQSLKHDDGRPALTKLPLSVEQLAALAVSHRFHLH